MQKINDYVLEGNLNGAKEHCKSSNNPIARMIEKGLLRVGKPMKDITTSIENIGKLELYFDLANSSISASVPGSWLPNWLHGNPKT